MTALDTLDKVLSVTVKLLEILVVLALVYIIVLFIRAAGDPNPAPNVFTKMAQITRFMMFGCPGCLARSH
jgi:hypothetical protein